MRRQDWTIIFPINVRLVVKLTSFVFAILALLGTCAPIVDVTAIDQTKDARPPKPEELVGVWVGFGQGEKFTRLDLGSEFTRYWTRLATRESTTHPCGIHVYRVTRWAVGGWKPNLTSYAC